MTVGPISQFWDIIHEFGWKFPRKFLLILVFLILLSFIYWQLLGTELKQKYLVFYRIAGGKPPWFYGMVIGWFVLILYFLYTAVAKIARRFLSSYISF
jgi:hypothetical protein